MRVHTELDRLGAARPPILRRTEEVVDSAEEDRLLHQILTDAGAPAPGRAPVGGPARYRRAGLLAGGLGLTAAVAAVVVVVASGVTTVPAGPATNRGPVGHSARAALLMDAATAARAPATTGAYWYVRTTYTGVPDTFTTWTVRNGTTWTRADKTDGAVIKVPMADDPGWYLEGSAGLPGTVVGYRVIRPHRRHVMKGPPWPGQVTFRQLQHLPTSPAALTAWVVAFNRKFLKSLGATALPHPEAGVVQCLIKLVAELPAPPQVRATAFRSLAALPGISMVGSHGVRFSLGEGEYTTLVVRSAASQVDAVVSATGGGQVDGVRVIAHWVNQLP